MNIGVLGTGVVGETLATALVACGHQVTMGSRTADNPRASAWAGATGDAAHVGTFADAARAGDLLVNATAGAVSLRALESAGDRALADKVLLDVSNPLDTSHGFPPSLSICNTDSVGEQLQRRFPALRVVKTLNTVTASVMVDPSPVGGNIFVAGNHDDAKTDARTILTGFGWDAGAIIDAGDITASRALEAYVLLWVRLYGAFGSPEFNVKVVRP